MTLEKLEANSQLNTENGCIEWTGPLNDGYGVTGVKKEDGKWALKKVHRLAHEGYVGEIPEGLCVLHRCDNRKCFSPEHLFLGTYQDNANDMMAKGRGKPARGEAHGRSRLVEKEVYRARELYSDGMSFDEISKKFGVTPRSIRRIANKETWKHLEDR